MFAKLKRRCSGKLMAFVPLVSASILGDIGSILDRIFGICMILLIIALILIAAWILSYFFGSGGGGRG